MRRKETVEHITEIHPLLRSNRPSSSSSSGCHFRLSPSKDLYDTVVVVVCKSGNVMSQQLSDGDGDPDGVGLAAPRLRDVRHTADQVLQGR